MLVYLLKILLFFPRELFRVNIKINTKWVLDDLCVDVISRFHWPPGEKIRYNKKMSLVYLLFLILARCIFSKSQSLHSETKVSNPLRSFIHLSIIIID